MQSKRDAGRGAHCARSSAECECLVIKLEGNSTGLGILLITVRTAEQANILEFVVQIILKYLSLSKYSILFT